jgi:hypothetical protein
MVLSLVRRYDKPGRGRELRRSMRGFGTVLPVPLVAFGIEGGLIALRTLLS